MFLNKINNKIFCFGVFIIFFILSIWFNKMPLPQINSHLPKGPDPLLVSWLWSWEMHQIPINPLTIFDANIFAPLKNTLAFTEHMFGSLLLAWPLFLIFKNIILVFNLISLSTFAVGGLGMYLLVFHLTKNKAASFIAAFIYAFAPYKIIHQEHINLSGMWLPYFFLYLHNVFENFSWKNTLLLLFFTLLVFLNAMQYFLFLPIVAVFFFFSHANTYRVKISSKSATKLAIYFFVLIIVCLPIISPYLRLKNQGFARSIDAVEGLSPDLFDYFISPFFYPHFYSAYLLEWVVGPGVFVFILLGCSLILLLRRHPFPKTAMVYSVIGLLAMFFSLGYYIQFTRGESGGIIGPWALFYHFIPGFSGIRCAGRYSVFFLLSTCVIIALGAKEFFIDKLKNNQCRISVFSIIILVLLFIEFGFVPTKEYVPALDTPKIYDWVKRQPDENLYLEMPFGYNYLKNHWDAIYEYWSISHFKKIVNGYSGYKPASLEKLNQQLHDPDLTHEQLSAIRNSGATHIIFHFNFYPPGFKERIINFLITDGRTELVQSADNDYVYQFK